MYRRIRTFLADSRRITTSGQWVPEVDGIRFVAIVLVLIHHIHERVLRRNMDSFAYVKGSWLDHILVQGDMGVLIFFTLSGYILGKGLIPPMDRGESVSLRKYFVRRLTRLEPPYVLVMAGIFLFLTVSGYRSGFTKSFNEGATSLWDALLASLIYGYGFIYGAYPKLNPPAWSLEVEVQFYVLAPFMAWALSRVRWSMRVVGLLLILLAWAVAISPIAKANPHFRGSIFVMMPFFLAGFCIVDLNDRLSIRARSSPLLGCALSLGCIASLLYLVLGELLVPSLVGVPGRAAAAFLFVLFALNGWGIRRFLANPWIAVIGGMCYSIYLIHLPLLEVAASMTSRFGRGLPYPLYFCFQFCVLGSLVLAVAWLFFRLVERPCMDRTWPFRLWTWFIATLRPRSLSKNEQTRL